MPLEEWIDCSNWSGVPTPGQVQAIRNAGVTGVVVGLQSFLAAKSQMARFGDLVRETYVDLPGRNISLAPPGSICWVDIEAGCFQRADAVRAEVERIKNNGLQPGIYTNEGGMAALGMTDEFGYLPLWYSNPDLVAFSPFCGWTEMLMWQYTGTTDIAKFGVDRNKRLVLPAPVVPTPEPDLTTLLVSLVSTGHLAALGDQDLNTLAPEHKLALRWVTEQFHDA